MKSFGFKTFIEKNISTDPLLEVIGNVSDFILNVINYFLEKYRNKIILTCRLVSSQKKSKIAFFQFLY